MFANSNNNEIQRLSWMQRIALIRYSFHTALRTNDFTFFKTLQAHTFLSATDHVATLTSLLGDEVDTVLHTLDDLSISLAYVHQDAFKTVYDTIRTSISEEENSRRAKIRIVTSQQRRVADNGIDKMATAVIALIENQEAHCQEAVANVWLFGATIVTDTMQTVLLQMERLESMMDDFILLESAWHMVQTAVEASVSALRGVFNLMATSERSVTTTTQNRNRSMSTASATGGRSRATSVGSAAGNLFKRLSTAMHSAPAPPATIPNNIANIDDSTPQQVRQIEIPSLPVSIPVASGDDQRKVWSQPSTPFETSLNPLDTDLQSLRPISSYSDSVAETMTEFSSPLDCDPLGSDDILQASGPRNYARNNLTFFGRFSKDSGSRPVVA